MTPLSPIRQAQDPKPDDPTVSNQASPGPQGLMIPLSPSGKPRLPKADDPAASNQASPASQRLMTPPSPIRQAHRVGPPILVESLSPGGLVLALLLPALLYSAD